MNSGDRVRVEFEGTADYVNHKYDTVRMKLDDGRVVHAPMDLATVLASPIEVGDKATIDVLHRLPFGSVIVSKGGLAAQLGNGRRHPGRAWLTSEVEMSHAIVSHWDATVVHIGGQQ